jgi:hypothetical protein
MKQRGACKNIVIESNTNIDGSEGCELELWFLAELIVVHACPEWESPLVHINYVLVQAKDGAAACDKAERMGESYPVEIRNSDGQDVTISFGGIRELYPLGAELTDGLELFYEERTDVSASEAAAWAVPRDQLRVFQRKGPNG